MSKNNFFKFPFGYFEESNGFESRKTKLDNMLEENVEVDALQTKNIESNLSAINAEVERSSMIDKQFAKHEKRVRKVLAKF